MSDIDQKRLLAVLGAIEAVSRMETSDLRDRLLRVMADMLVIENNPAIVVQGETRHDPVSFTIRAA